MGEIVRMDNGKDNEIMAMMNDGMMACNLCRIVLCFCEM